MSIQIESGVPIPARIPARNKYPIHKLKVGDSFFVPMNNIKTARNLRATLATKAKKQKISVVSIADDTGVRVWRTA